MNDKTRLIVAAVGIFVCYFYFGVLQEKITRGRYGDEPNEDGIKGERFTFTLALVGIQCIFNWAFARGEIHWNFLNFPTIFNLFLYFSYFIFHASARGQNTLWLLCEQCFDLFAGHDLLKHGSEMGCSKLNTNKLKSPKIYPSPPFVSSSTRPR